MDTLVSQAVVSEVNFSNAHPWLFKLADMQRIEYLVMQGDYYKSLGISSPVTRYHLDALDKGATVSILYRNVGGINVVTQMS